MFKIMKENVEDLRSANLWLALPSEFIGTLFITVLGCGTWCVPSQAETLRVALTFGLAVATVVWVFSHISGAHVNPAVTVAALFTRRVSIIRGILYILAQVIGGIVGAGLLYGLTPSNIQGNLGSNELINITSAQGFGVELLITFVYVLAVFSCLDDKRKDLRGSFPLTIGLAVVMCHLFAIPYTKAGLNPARSFGPALIANFWEKHWVFWVGPIAGALLAGLTYDYVFSAGATFAGAKKCLLRTKKPRKEPEPEKAPLEEVKTDGAEIEETKLDGEKEVVAEVDVEKGKSATEELS